MRPAKNKEIIAVKRSFSPRECGASRCVSEAEHVLFATCTCGDGNDCGATVPMVMLACMKHMQVSVRRYPGLLGFIPYRAGDWTDEMVWIGADA